MTKQTAICEALAKLGHAEKLNYNTTKYRVFTRKDGTFYFVGKAGSLRYGRTVGESFSASPETIRTIILKAKKVKQ